MDDVDDDDGCCCCCVFDADSPTGQRLARLGLRRQRGEFEEREKGRKERERERAKNFSSRETCAPRSLSCSRLPVVSDNHQLHCATNNTATSPTVSPQSAGRDSERQWAALVAPHTRLARPGKPANLASARSLANLPSDCISLWRRRLVLGWASPRRFCLLVVAVLLSLLLQCGVVSEAGERASRAPLGAGPPDLLVCWKAQQASLSARLQLVAELAKKAKAKGG